MINPVPQERLLPYVVALPSRDLSQVDLLVIHCTELPDLETARSYGEKIHYPESGTGNSGHFYIDRDGSMEMWVPSDRVAHHVRGFNERSVGIELVNLGRYPDWLHSAQQSMQEPYPASQIVALSDLIQQLTLALPQLRWIAGHEQLDTARVPASDNPAVEVQRKLDPGPHFPWRQVLQSCSLLEFES